MIYDVYWCGSECAQLWQFKGQVFKERVEEKLYELYTLIPSHTGWDRDEESLWTNDETELTYLVSIDYSNGEIYIEEY